MGGNGASLTTSLNITSTIENLQTFEDTRLAINPIPLASVEDREEVATGRWYRNDQGFQDIPVSKIQTMQKTVSRKNLLSMANDNLPADTINGYAEIRVVKYKGHYILDDGNHRTALAKLQGKKTVRAHVYELK